MIIEFGFPLTFSDSLSDNIKKILEGASVAIQTRFPVQISLCYIARFMSPNGPQDNLKE